MLSWFKSGHWSQGFILNLQFKDFLNIIRNQFDIFCQVIIAFNPCTTGFICNFSTTIQSITTSNTTKSASKKIIFETFYAPSTALPESRNLQSMKKVEEKSSNCMNYNKDAPAISLAGMPHINTVCKVACLIGIALTDF